MINQRQAALCRHEIISSAARYPNWLVLLCSEQTIYVTRSFVIGKLVGPKEIQPVASLAVPPLLRYAARLNLLRRLGRLDIRELIQVDDSHLVAVIQKQLVKFDHHNGHCRTVFEVTDGGRPKGFALTPAGHILVGEYWSNPQRQALRIWASTDAGDTWALAYSLPPGSAKHIHNLVWDPHRQGLWVLTGDAEGECALLFTGDEFRTVTEVVRGGQMWRACQLFCLPEGLYYGTDTERAPNWWVFLDVNRMALEKIQPLPGSCIYAARLAGRWFLSTSVEPSKINKYRRTVLWSSPDLQQWCKLVEFDKDWLPGEYFGFGSVVLPRVQGDCPFLAFSTVAVRKADLSTFVVAPESLELSETPRSR
jgi:hypothetical protein